MSSRYEAHDIWYLNLDQQQPSATIRYTETPPKYILLGLVTFSSSSLCPFNGDFVVCRLLLYVRTLKTTYALRTVYSNQAILAGRHDWPGYSYIVSECRPRG